MQTTRRIAVWWPLFDAHLVVIHVLSFDLNL